MYAEQADCAGCLNECASQLRAADIDLRRIEDAMKDCSHEYCDGCGFDKAKNPLAAKMANLDNLVPCGMRLVEALQQAMNLQARILRCNAARVRAGA